MTKVPGLGQTQKVYHGGSRRHHSGHHQNDEHWVFQLVQETTEGRNFLCFLQLVGAVLFPASGRFLGSQASCAGLQILQHLVGSLQIDFLHATYSFLI